MDPQNRQAKALSKMSTMATTLEGKKMSEYEIINRDYHYDNALEITLRIPCTEIASSGAWGEGHPNYLVTDIHSAIIRLQNHGFIDHDFYLRMPRHIYESFKQLKIGDVPAQEWLKDHHFIEKVNIMESDENCVSLMVHSAWQSGFSDLGIHGWAIKITDISISQGVQGVTENE